MPNRLARSALAFIPQLPLDPASGAARSTRALCELLARNGWDVRFVATTGSERGQSLALAYLRSAHGIDGINEPATPGGRDVLRFVHRGISYRLLDTAGYSIDEARCVFAADIDALVSAEMASQTPDLFLTYGSSEAEVRRRAMVRAAGTKVVFLLRNLAYYHPRSFSEVDVIITPSRFSSEQYRGRSGIDTVPLPPCLCLEDTVAALTEPVFCTFINPSPEKGVLFFLRVVQAATARRRDIPWLVVESRGSGSLLGAAARGARVNLEPANLHIARNTAEPQRIYSVTRVLLVPSTGPETAGLVALEAQLNGIPVIASNRGGLPETVGSGGFILPVADAVRDKTSSLVNTWLELICRLYDEPDFFRFASRASYEAAARYRNGDVDRLYLQLFEELLARL